VFTPRVGFRGLYLALLAGWLALSIISLLIVVVQSKGAFDQAFEREASASFNELRNKLRANEVAISSFSSFFAAADLNNRDAIALFAANLKNNYPHIYMFEVVRKVARHERAAFETYMQSALDPAFRIKNFGYDDNRQWKSVRDKAVYYPLIFMWPEIPAAKSIFGLDMDSVPHLQQAAFAADAGNRTVTSKPFRLVEGDLAYAMFHPVNARHSKSGKSQNQMFSGSLQVLLIIRAQDLVPAQQQAASSYRISINGLGQNDPLLLDLPGSADGFLGEDHWLPRESLTFTDENLIEPLKLTVERQMLWTDISANSLFSVGLLSIVSLIGLIFNLHIHYQNLIESSVRANQAEFLAMHDTLTGLPNRLLFNDRLNLLLSNWRRRSESFGLVYIDLDLFKEINDQLGHQAGDLVLIEVAKRIRGCIRESDTVARLGGDEFVVLLGQVNSREHLLTVAQQMLAEIAQEMAIGDQNIRITASVGISICPDDGVEAATLLDRADSSMYLVKQGGRNGVLGFVKPLLMANEHPSEKHLQRIK
jgi:diguanylate cyclase (GGDEF)-like protein